MHPAIEAALELQQFLDEHGEKFCIIGGLAVQRWGEVRLTVDADATVKWIVFSVIEPGNDFVGLGQNIPLRRGLSQRWKIYRPWVSKNSTIESPM